MCVSTKNGLENSESYFLFVATHHFHFLKRLRPQAFVPSGRPRDSTRPARRAVEETSEVKWLKDGVRWGSLWGGGSWVVEETFFSGDLMCFGSFWDVRMAGVQKNVLIERPVPPTEHMFFEECFVGAMPWIIQCYSSRSGEHRWLAKMAKPPQKVDFGARKVGKASMPPTVA